MTTWKPGLLTLLFAVAATGCPRSAQTPSTPPPSAETGPASAPASAPAEAPPAETAGVKAAGQPCAGGGECAEGLHCTTADGACDRPPGCKDGDICPTVCYGVCAAAAEKAADGATPAACKTDADCEPVAHYCDGCHCLARLKGAPAPTCAGKTVSCIANPCDGQTAQCLEGACRIPKR